MVGPIWKVSHVVGFGRGIEINDKQAVCLPLPPGVRSLNRYQLSIRCRG